MLDEDCPEEYFCKKATSCILITEGMCRTDENCEEGETCDANKCVASGGGSCQNSLDCLVGELCIDQECLVPVNECATNDDCPREAPECHTMSGMDSGFNMISYNECVVPR